MCAKFENKEVIYLILNVIIFGRIYTQETDYTSATTETISATTLTTVPHEILTASNYSININSSRLSVTNPSYQIVTNSPTSRKKSLNKDHPVTNNQHHANLLPIHTHNHNPSQTEMFLGQVTLNSPAELPPEFSSKELVANLMESAVLFPKLTPIQAQTTAIPLLSTRRPIFPPLYLNFKPTIFTIMPKNKLLDLEPLLEEPINRNEYDKHNKQDVEVIVNSATPETTSELSSISTLAASNTSDVTSSQLNLTQILTTELPKHTQNEKLANTEIIYTSSSTVSTRVASRIVSEVISRTTTIKPEKHIYSNLTTSFEISSTTVKPGQRATENKNVTMERQEKEEIASVAIDSVRNYMTTSTNPFSGINNVTDRSVTKLQTIKPHEIEIKENSPKRTTLNRVVSTSQPLKLNNNWSINPSASPSFNRSKVSFSRDNLYHQRITENKENKPAKVLAANEMFRKNKLLALVKASPAKLDSFNLPVPLKKNVPEADKITLSSKITKLASFNVCSEKCELAGIIKIIDGVSWIPELSNRNTIAWHRLAKEIQLQLQITYSKSGILRKWCRNIRVDGFSEGSVLVDYIVELTNIESQINTLEIRRLFHQSLDEIENLPKNLRKTEKRTMNFGNFTIDPIYTDFIVLPQDSPTMVEYAESKLLPQWAIAVIVIGLASLLFVIIFAITILTNRRKTTKRKIGLPFSQDMFGDINKKNVLRLDDYCGDNIYNME